MSCEKTNDNTVNLNTDNIINAEVLEIDQGDSSAPSILFTDTTTTGIYGNDVQTGFVGTSGSIWGYFGSVFNYLATAKFDSGLVGAPSIRFLSSTTGIYAPATGEVAVTSSGAEVANFSSKGFSSVVQPTFIAGMSAGTSVLSGVNTLVTTLVPTTTIDIGWASNIISINTTGYYLLNSSMSFTNTTSPNVSRTWFGLNGVAGSRFAFASRSNTSGITEQLNGSAVVYLTDTDSLYFTAWQNQTASLTVGDAAYSFISVTMLH